MLSAPSASSPWNAPCRWGIDAGLELRGPKDPQALSPQALHLPSSRAGWVAGAGEQSWDWALGTTPPFAQAGQGTPPQLQTGGWGGG